MVITKIALINGAYTTLRISGLTSSATPEDIRLALDTADDLAMMLKGRGLHVNWNEPEEYGQSEPNDDSGIDSEIAGPFKHALAFYLCTAFGKSATAELSAMYSGAIDAIANFCVTIPKSQFGSTLPRGNANAWPKGNNFYPQPRDPYSTRALGDATHGYIDETNNYTEEFDE